SSQILVTLTRVTLDFISAGLNVLKNLKLPASLMMHLNLKGNVIWGKDDPTMYLDGEAFGATRTDSDGSTHIGFRLPSGDGKRGGNFEMCFGFVSPIPLTNLSLTPGVVGSGHPSTGTLPLSGPAPAGGATVTLSSNNANIIGALPTLTIPANQSTATFPI